MGARGVAGGGTLFCGCYKCWARYKAGDTLDNDTPNMNLDSGNYKTHVLPKVKSEAQCAAASANTAAGTTAAAGGVTAAGTTGAGGSTAAATSAATTAAAAAGAAPASSSSGAAGLKPHINAPMPGRNNTINR